MPLDPSLTEFTTTGPTNTIFNWEDVVASIGYKTFYALNNTEGTDLITSQIPSWSVTTVRTSDGSTELNFDHEFLAAADIGGTGYVEFTVQVIGDSSGPMEEMINKIRLLHVNSGGSETEIVAEISKTITTPTATITRVSMTLTISNTHFAVGDKLRLEYIMTVNEETVGTFTLYHDPANRGSPGNDQSGAPADTTFKLTIPFRIPL